MNIIQEAANYYSLPFLWNTEIECIKNFCVHLVPNCFNVVYNNFKRVSAIVRR